MQYFNRNVTITGGVPTSVASLLTANGYTGTFFGTELTRIASPGADLYIGDSSSVDATYPSIPMGKADTERGSGLQGDHIDPTKRYVYSVADQTFTLIFRSL